MSRVPLPILTLPVKTQRYSCHGCGDCCRDFTVQLRKADLKTLREQGWEEKLGEPITIKFRGVHYLRQRADGACIFLQDDGLCRIHAEYSFEEKPIACQFFPFSLTPVEGQVAMGVNFACQSVRASKGAELPTHVTDLKRMAASVPEIEPAAMPPMLTRDMRAVAREVKALNQRTDVWLRNTEHDLATRLHGLAWVASSLGKAKLISVREGRFKDLLDILYGAMPQELELLDNDPPTPRQMKMLRQAAFARVEDPKLSGVESKGRLATVLGQLGRSRRFASGKGTAPHIGASWPAEISLAGVETVGPAADEADAEAIDDLVTRWLRSTLMGGRAWGAGYYGWTIIEGLQALVLNAAVVGWLARLHAHGRGRKTIDLEAVAAAISRVDRTAGRAAWLGSGAERMRLTYLRIDDGLRRLVCLWR